MAQVFYASPTDTFTWPNGAVGHRPGGPMDCLGPFAKVHKCPVNAHDKEVARLTCYATGYPDTWFSVPACTRYRGKHIKGFFTTDDDGVKFCVMDSHKHHFEEN